MAVPLQYSYPEKPHGQRNLAGYSPWGPKESDTSQVTYTHIRAHAHKPIKLDSSGGAQILVYLLTSPCTSDTQPWLRTTAPVLRTSMSWGGNCRRELRRNGARGEGIACN